MRHETYQLLASLASDRRIKRFQDEVSNRRRRLVSDLSYDTMQLVRLDLSLFHPSGKMTRFSVKSITSKSYKWSAIGQSLDTAIHTLLGSNCVNASIRAQHSAVVLNVSVSHTKTKINQHVLTYWVGDNFSEDFPAMQLGIILRMLATRT